MQDQVRRGDQNLLHKASSRALLRITDHRRPAESAPQRALFLPLHLTLASSLPLDRLTQRIPAPLRDHHYLKTRLPEANAELHLVREPQGRRRSQHISGRISGSGYTLIEMRRGAVQERSMPRSQPEYPIILAVLWDIRANDIHSAGRQQEPDRPTERTKRQPPCYSLRTVC